MDDFFILFTLNELKTVADCIERRKDDVDRDSREHERLKKLLVYLDSQIAAEEKTKKLVNG
jgi:hypothetical protein